MSDMADKLRALFTDLPPSDGRFLVPSQEFADLAQEWLDRERVEVKAREFTKRVNVTDEDLADPLSDLLAHVGQEMAATLDAKLRAQLGNPTDDDLRRLADAGWRLCDHGLTPDSETDWSRDGDTVSIRFYSRIHLLPPGELCGGWKATLPGSAGGGDE